MKNVDEATSVRNLGQELLLGLYKIPNKYTVKKKTFSLLYFLMLNITIAMCEFYFCLQIICYLQT